MQQQILIQTSLQVKSGKTFFWKDFFSFRKMITLKVIQIIYFIGAAFITLNGILIMFSVNQISAFLPRGIISGLAIIVFGNVLWRITCELIIIFFRINKTLSDIDNHSKVEHLSGSFTACQ